LGRRNYRKRKYKIMDQKVKGKVVLAFSGGLDTTYCVKYLSEEMGLEVYTVMVDTGGFSKEEIDEAKERAEDLGVKEHLTIDATQKFYEKVIKFLVFGNVLKNNTYPLSVSAERVVQAMEIANYTKKIGADFLAHGSTGAGNDQVRFDLIFNILVPDVKILTPIRDQKLSRAEEMEFLEKYGVDLNWQKAKYSINKGLWGTTVGGDETLTSDKGLPEQAFPTQISQNETISVKLHFTDGELTGLNGKSYTQIEAIKKLNKIAGEYAIGRDMHIGDTVIGIKGRVGFEAPAALITIKAHHALEKHVLTKWQQHWKEQLANWYGMMLHEGQFLEPVMRNIEGFLESTQKNVSGVVEVLLAPYRFEVVGIGSDHDLMNSKFGSYGEMNNGWTGEDVKGFTKIFANQTKMYYQVNPLQ
jgi:argininosuccinate synthase